MAQKKYLGIDVLTAARVRIARVFDDFPRIYVSFSGGKDSSVMLHLVCEEARRRRREVGVLFVDLEAQYGLTIEHIEEMLEEYRDVIDPYWLALPISLRNAVSQFEPQWRCWEPGREMDWVRQPPKVAITSSDYFPWFRAGMEFEELVPAFGEWYSRGLLTACFVGIRTDESLNRWRTITRKKKQRFEGLQWTTRAVESVFNCYPIYDWRTRDIWIYNGKTAAKYNRLYERMNAAGLSIHQQRICQPYGDDQRKGLWLFQVIEPETWARVVARVNGANSGALYALESGNINGVRKVTKPAGHTWESFAKMLLASMPPSTRDHYENKIAVFLHWYSERGYSAGSIPDEGSATDRDSPSWTRICKALLRNDYWCKGLSFTQHKSDAYENYKRIMKNRRMKWGLI